MQQRMSFSMRVILFCTISHFPAYGNLSGYNVKGYKACSICEEETYSLYLKNCIKMIYMGHMRFLSKNHLYHCRKVVFNGKAEHMVKPCLKRGYEILACIMNIQNRFGKGNGQYDYGVWKKRSIFFFHIGRCLM